MRLPRSEHEVRFAEAQGRMVYKARIEHGMTRRDLAEASGLTQQSIFRIEMGDSTASSFDLAMIARALATTVQDLTPNPALVAPKAGNLSASVAVMWSLAKRTRLGGALA